VTDPQASPISESRQFPYPVGISIALFVVTVVYRFHDRVTTVFDWDNVQYLLALSHFDPVAHQPHPPGHPLYVFAAWFLAIGVHDGQLAYQLVNIAFLALGTVLVYLLGRKIFDDLTGIGAALIYMVSPLAGYFVAFPNTFGLEGMMGAALWLILVEWLSDRKVGDSTKPGPQSILLLPWVFGILSGIRPSFLAFAMPAVLYTVFSRRPKSFPLVLVHGLVASALWFVPLIILSGGLSRYFLGLDAEAEPFLRPFSIPNILTNLSLLKNYGFGLLGYFALVPLVYGIVAGVRALIAKPGSDRDRFLTRIGILSLLWVAPILLYHVLSYVHPGFTVFYLPIAAIGLARFLIWISRAMTAGRKPYYALLAGLLILAIASILVFQWIDRRTELFSRASIRNSETRVNAFLGKMRDDFPLDRTAIVSMEHFRQVQWYLPETYVIFPQAAYVKDFGWDPDRANLYIAHDREVSPPAWHMKRSGPVPPIILPKGIEFVVVSPADSRHLGNPEGFNIGRTEVGEEYLWRRYRGRIAITMDGDRWWVETPAPGEGK